MSALPKPCSSEHRLILAALPSGDSDKRSCVLRGTLCGYRSMKECRGTFGTSKCRRCRRCCGAPSGYRKYRRRHTFDEQGQRERQRGLYQPNAQKRISKWVLTVGTKGAGQTPKAQINSVMQRHLVRMPNLRKVSTRAFSVTFSCGCACDTLGKREEEAWATKPFKQASTCKNAKSE